ncbi:hypothetical protein K1719_003932 [Acacia pycnantha]|nr:hypothetical protein K1719_003932 [Acacia pycnantha]
MYFHGARFSNYEAWLSDPTHIGPSAQVVWPIVGQEILNGDVGGGFQGIQITSGFFQIWRASGITSELQLYCTAIGALVFADLNAFSGWFHYHKAAPKLAWFQDVESMLNHHLAGLLGLGSLSWAGINSPYVFYASLSVSSYDYGTQLSLFTHHMWIGGFLIVGAAAHAAIFMVRDYDPTTRYNDLLDRVLRHRDAIISHLNWVCIFLGFHSRDVWGSISDQGVVTHITGGNFARVPLPLMGGSAISYGRRHPRDVFVGVTHYLLGGIATTWAFFLARIIAVG